MGETATRPLAQLDRAWESLNPKIAGSNPTEDTGSSRGASAWPRHCSNSPARNSRRTRGFPSGRQFAAEGGRRGKRDGKATFLAVDGNQSAMPHVIPRNRHWTLTKAIGVPALSSASRTALVQPESITVFTAAMLVRIQHAVLSRSTGCGLGLRSRPSAAPVLADPPSQRERSPEPPRRLMRLGFPCESFTHVCPTGEPKTVYAGIQAAISVQCGE